MKTLKHMILLVIFLAGTPLHAHAAGLWGSAKAYTGLLQAAADDAAALAAAAAAAVVAAGQEVVARQAQVAQLQAALAANPQLILPAGTLATAAAKLASAQAALGTASATSAQLAAAAKVAAAAVAAWTAGTLIGQGVVWIEHLCWDPVCDWTALDLDGPIYRPADPHEVDALVEVLLTQAVDIEVPDLPRTVADLVALGPPGVVMLDYLRGQVTLLLAYHRGAAAASAARFDEVVAAGDDLQRLLQVIPAQQRAFGELLRDIVVEDGRLEVAEAVELAAGDLAEVRDLLAAAQAERPQRPLAALIADLDVVRADLAGLPAAVGAALEGVRLGAMDAFIPAYTQADHEAFRERCAREGEACIPSKEISFLVASMAAAGVHSPELGEALGPAIATWDAEPLGAWEARHLADGDLTGVESMMAYAAVPEEGCGFWRGADLGQSPLLIEARPRAGWGDANQDGALDVLDLQQRVNLALAGERGQAADDLNADGQVDVRDVQANVNLILEQPVVGLCPPINVDGSPPHCIGMCEADGAVSEGPTRTLADCVVAIATVCGGRGVLPPVWNDGGGPTTCLCAPLCDDGGPALQPLPGFETASLNTCVLGAPARCAERDASVHSVRCVAGVR